MSQEAPTDWISPPKLEIRLAIQTIRKMGMLNGDIEGGGSGLDMVR